MEHADIVAQRIIERNDHFKSDSGLKKTAIAFQICCFAKDFAQLCKNIKETSISEMDRMHRCESLANATGVDIYYCKLLTS